MENKEKSPKSRFRLAAVLAAAAAVLCLAVFLLADPYGGRILDNTWIAGVDVSGMTKAEAGEALASLAADFSQKPLVVALPQETLRLQPEDTGLTLDVTAAINAAYAYGRTGTREEKKADEEASLTTTRTIGLLPFLTWNQQAILDALENYASRYDTQFAESSFTLDAPLPELKEDSFLPDSPVPSLVVSMGMPGFQLDVEALYDQILDACNDGSFLVDWSKVPADTIPQAPDLEEAYLQYHTPPADAALDPQTKQLTPAAYGLTFDLGQAQTLASEAGYGETLTIPLVAQAPGTLLQDLLYQDVLGSYISGHSDRPNIVKNLQLVCQYLDGVIIQPGEVFSYNDTLGERTVERGFMYGESFSGMQESTSAGGGVCQGSSVLHVCVLEADLEVVERVCHGLTVGYTPLGQDAAVSWGGPDFRFRNNTNYPIKIVATYTDKDIRFQLLGTDEKSYYIELEATQGHDQYQIYANCYKRKYDKATGKLLSRELAAHSAYLYTGG